MQTELYSTPFFSDANLQGYWRLESNGNDSGANGYNLSSSGSPTYATGKYGNGIDLELSSSQYLYITTATNLAITGNRTFGAWVKVESLEADRTILAKCNSASSVLVRLQIQADGTAHFQISNLTSGNKSAVSSGTVTTGQWAHVIGVYDGTDLKVFLNGTKSSISATGTSTDPGGQFGVGILGGSSGFPNYFDGVIDDAFVMNRALTDAEVQLVYNYSVTRDIIGTGFIPFAR